MATTDPAPEGFLRVEDRERRSELRRTPILDLAHEVYCRIQEGDGFGTDVMRANEGVRLLHALQADLDVHDNRFSRRHYADMFWLFFAGAGADLPVDGATYLNMGCGSFNPGGFLFVLLMAGIHRGIAMDMDTIHDVPRALKALADCAGMMLADPSAVAGDYPLTREQILANIASFDLHHLRLGQMDGLDPDRLRFVRESILDCSIGDEEIDVVFSNAVLEHLPDMDPVIGELARITRTGGFGVHNIDASDHWSHSNPDLHPLAFLGLDPGAPFVHESNRLRIFEFERLFEKHGLEVVDTFCHISTEVSEELRDGFVEPFRSMPCAELGKLCARVTVRKS